MNPGEPGEQGRPEIPSGQKEIESPKEPEAAEAPPQEVKQEESLPAPEPEMVIEESGGIQHQEPEAKVLSSDNSRKIDQKDIVFDGYIADVDEANILQNKILESSENE